MITIWMILAIMFGNTLLCLFVATRFLHMLQLESYHQDGFIRYLKAQAHKTIFVTFLLTVLVFIAEAILQNVFWDNLPLAQMLGLIVYGVVGMIYGILGMMMMRNAKKKIVFTARMKRLYLFVGIGMMAVQLLLLIPAQIFHVLVIALIFAFLPLFVYLGNEIAQPFENLIYAKFFTVARDKLAGYQSMIKIGITGSYGKTSAKFILGTILSEKYKVKVTPHSYNTPMGVCRVINDDLDDRYEVFIAEMGARYVGDIQQMCALVRPQYGLITSVGPQHLETFGNVETVAKTKYELIEALPQDGVAFFPHDGGICDTLYEKTDKKKKRFGLVTSETVLDLTADDIRVGPDGSDFSLATATGEKASCHTRLLGKHNILNILGAATVAQTLGLSLEEIAKGIEKIEPIEHRLQIVPTNNGITVIDDAFNASPIGTRAALDVLSQFDGRKIIITPGLVELGEKEAEENIAFGQAMAEVVDIAILVGEKRAMQMAQGLDKANFNKENIYIVASLNKATEQLAAISQIGDVILFENDLPDNYNE